MSEYHPTAEFLARIFAISPNGNGAATCFAHKIDDYFCLVTAAHVLVGMEHGKETTVLFYTDKNWKEIKVTPYFYSERPYIEGDVDVAILKTKISAKGDKTPLILSSSNMLLGQDCFLLGFPFFGKIRYKPEKINFGFPIPFVKKACLSALASPIFYFDGHNNPGFSGGPIIFWDRRKKKAKIAAVISGYLLQPGVIEEESEKKRVYYENSGIVVGYNIKSVTDLMIKVFGKDVSNHVD